MGYFYVDTSIIGDPLVLELEDKKFRVLIESACRYNRTRDPADAPPAEFMHLFRFQKRRKGGRRKVRHDRDQLWHRFYGICYLCSEKVDYLEFHIEHVVPLARGGHDAVENLNIAHPECNIKKGTRLLSELDWYVA